MCHCLEVPCATCASAEVLPSSHHAGVQVGRTAELTSCKNENMHYRPLSFHLSNNDEATHVSSTTGVCVCVCVCASYYTCDAAGAAAARRCSVE